MPASPSAPAGNRKALMLLVGGLAVLAVFLLVTKVVMAPKSTSTAPTTVPAAHGQVRSVAAAASAAAKKLDNTTAADPAHPTTTIVTGPTTTVAPGTAGDTSGPKPNTVRNPFEG